MPDFNQNQQDTTLQTKSPSILRRLLKVIGAIVLIFLLLFIMNYVVKREVSQLIETGTIPDNIEEITQ
ncbi:hypothetical protein DC083_03620 [Ignatzschineria ureiclastica]|uniref:Uncharacterized protein n=1 Tax=Ignatzschineria ureiclastica TaxID=472582 RepID=A0A2U2AFV4_9GAMM|nr:hypothetical protein [Ignatzschineria ureiclastica]PWD81541.1 hypothetical protein DC083_03620 [Ignatzschineria ureiclastica]GHA01501.1 hypothetical protein GCM10007162_17320 [Ignatzschineria ureiclastica]